MNPILRNILAVIVGALVGGAINAGLVQMGYSVIGMPQGLDPNNLESFKTATFEAQHFIFPFLAHALGTLVGAFLAAKLAATRKMSMALVIGFFFIIGGIAAVFMIPAPIWFIVLDLVMAYIPMAWLGGKLAGAK